MWPAGEALPALLGWIFPPSSASISECTAAYLTTPLTRSAPADPYPTSKPGASRGKR